MRFERDRKIADAVLYEGYVLYPYRASSAKNQFRWQFGTLAPREYNENGGCEPWDMQTEVLIESQGSPLVEIKVRFLQVQARSVEAAADAEGERFEPVAELVADGRLLVPWEEGIEREADLHAVRIADLLREELTMPLEVPAECGFEMVYAADGEVKGRIVRERRATSAVVKCSAEQVGAYTKLRVRIENLTPWGDGGGEGGGGPELIDGNTHPARGFRRRVSVGHRSARSGPRGGLGVFEPAHLAGVRGKARRERPDAVLADHPLRLSRRGSRESRRPVRRYRDRRDSHAARHDDDRRRETRGERNR